MLLRRFCLRRSSNGRAWNSDAPRVCVCMFVGRFVCGWCLCVVWYVLGERGRCGCLGSEFV